ncbi:MAG TPA: PTS sugar transporter subunit IIA [Spirochaetia bacterium]|nr:PTS sugar transporter subunit IIA [Spirochaetales bacterium]HPD79734.1 PTS sugar transporter subunit IIA [Spirochaetales bacterium]HQK34600.1 PTS sugar transporter subunit IIA [Spirochaetales bacterium]HRS65026.1 PTS sugar transporter subunit IIA [Spirochaetia bacterium]HRV30036.1 PTS sugar transporter subunit IIA [Spirochaetia bacterium]
MEEEILTIEEVAKYLRVSERTVYDWAQKGEIPAGKIGTVWRFRKNEIERWVNERLSGNKPQSVLQILSMKNIITPERIIFLNYPRKRDALIALAENLATAPQVKNKGELVMEILRREELMSTAIGRGVAIPHVRLTSITDLVVSVGISTCDITDFTAFDDTTVRILFMIGSAYNQHAYYLQTLSYFSSLLKSDELRQALINAKTTDEVYGLLIKADNR